MDKNPKRIKKKDNPYSIRKNTKASLMEQVSDNIKKRRVHEILELSDKFEEEYYKKFINKELEVLIEETNDEYSIGHTDNYIKVRIDEKLKHNSFYKVIVKEVVKKEVKGILKT